MPASRVALPALSHRGSTSQDGKVKTTYEQDLKVTQQWMDFLDLKILSQQQQGDQVRASVLSKSGEYSAGISNKCCQKCPVACAGSPLPRWRAVWLLTRSD
jgi:hypothetical protein